MGLGVVAYGFYVGGCGGVRRIAGVVDFELSEAAAYVVAGLGGVSVCVGAGDWPAEGVVDGRGCEGFCLEEIGIFGRDRRGKKFLPVPESVEALFAPPTVFDLSSSGQLASVL